MKRCALKPWLRQIVYKPHDLVVGQARLSIFRWFLDEERKTERPLSAAQARVAFPLEKKQKTQTPSAEGPGLDLDKLRVCFRTGTCLAPVLHGLLMIPGKEEPPRSKVEQGLGGLLSGFHIMRVFLSVAIAECFFFGGVGESFCHLLRKSATPSTRNAALQVAKRPQCSSPFDADCGRLGPRDLPLRL